MSYMYQYGNGFMKQVAGTVRTWMLSGKNKQLNIFDHPNGWDS